MLGPALAQQNKQSFCYQSLCQFNRVNKSDIDMVDKYLGSYSDPWHGYADKHDHPS